MKVYKVTLLIIDNDEIGGNEIKSTLENTRYPNRCISPEVKEIVEREICEWSDDHPLNNIHTSDAEYRRLFEDKEE
jgi:hypothetical protein